MAGTYTGEHAQQFTPTPSAHRCPPRAYDPDTESITGTFLGGATGYGEGPGTFVIALQP